MGGSFMGGSFMGGSFMGGSFIRGSFMGGSLNIGGRLLSFLFFSASAASPSFSQRNSIYSTRSTLYFQLLPCT